MPIGSQMLIGKKKKMKGAHQADSINLDKNITQYAHCRIIKRKLKEKKKRKAFFSLTILPLSLLTFKLFVEIIPHDS